MHSVKNLLVIILLMGVSYGAYQVITTPESTAMSSDMEEMFHKVIKFVEKESNSGLALVAFYEEDHLELMRLDPEHANEVIDSATNGLIL